MAHRSKETEPARSNHQISMKGEGTNKKSTADIIVEEEDTRQLKEKDEEKEWAVLMEEEGIDQTDLEADPTGKTMGDRVNQQPQIINEMEYIPEIQDNMELVGSSSNSPGTRDKNKRCYRCGEFGHIRWNCGRQARLPPVYHTNANNRVPYNNRILHGTIGPSMNIICPRCKSSAMDITMEIFRNMVLDSVRHM